ncbi:MAG: SsrA-binding protein SmpB [Microbacterium sp.]
MAKKKTKSHVDPNQRVIATNRRARHEYTIEKTYEAGLVLRGTEVKSLREGHANLTDGYAFVDRGEAWLDQVSIAQYSNGTWTNHAAKRARKLLLHKDEIVKLGAKASAGGYTLVPLKLYFVDGRAKVEIGVAKGKTQYDKRQTLRERQDKRDAERAMRTRNRMGE